MLSSPSGFTEVTQHIEDLAKQSQDVDYAELTSKITVLDLAIDAGFSTRNWAEEPGAEKQFNDAVTRLAHSVRELDSGLIGGGLSDLHKPTAKAALNRLWWRLQYSVRTTPPPQKDYLGGFEGEQERKVQFMSKWTRKGTDG